ncbi:MAG: rod shape-determining protein MreC [Oscillospiraceae bacterium]|nr:MAG: rod shape-determining protein MreC [Oscillospiraceae bacterium]
MGDFFKSTRFKILALALAFVLAFTLRAAYSGTAIPMIGQLAAWMMTPLQRVSASLSYAASDAATALFSGHRLAAENEELKSENARLRSMLVEYERTKSENEQLREYLQIREQNPDFDFEPAMVVGRDTASRFYSFTIDRGSNSGISVNDPVITEEGLVGIVSEVGLTYSKVLTILDVSVQVGVMDSATREIGVTSGELSLAEEGLLLLSYLPRESQAQTGDLIVTTGVGGLFPRDLVIGAIRELRPDSKGLSLSAVIEPPADLRAVRDVLVIKSFAGQTAIEPAQ